MDARTLTATTESAGTRLDAFLAAQLPGLTRWTFGAAEASRIAAPTLSLLGSESDALGRRFGDAHRFLLAHLPDVEEGILPGGGVALLQAAAAVKEKVSGELSGDELVGAQIVFTAASAPLKQIAENAGLEGGVVAEKVAGLEPGKGLNAATGEYVDMLEAGIPDPAKVTRSALQNAASIAALFLTTEAVIADKPEKAPAMPAGGDDMGGMGF